MATSTYLQNTHSGTGSNTGAKATMSVWVKRTDIAGDDRSTIIGARTDDNNYFKIRFADNDRLMVFGLKSGSGSINIETDAEFRDVFGWYHVVLQIDTTSSTETERVKWYVNGELQTIRSSGRNYPDQNDVNQLTSASDINIGCNAVGSPNEHFDGTMSHFHMIDGTIYPPTAFGSTDSVTGEWQINTSPSVTYGAKGFFILKDGNSVTDQSGNGNNFTVGGGTLTKTEDCPSNVFATWNSLANQGSVDLYNGNTRAVFSTGGWYFVYSTLGASSGKYYYEVKVENGGSDSSIGIMEMDTATNEQGTADNVGKNTESVGYLKNGSIKKNNSTVQTGLGSISNGEIVGIAMDLDNNTVQFYLQGVARGTAVSIASDKTYAFATSGYGSAEHHTNFGNGYFENTAVSSAGTNASGIGIFEYDVPSGYTALSTKGLNL